MPSSDCPVLVFTSPREFKSPPTEYLVKKRPLHRRDRSTEHLNTSDSVCSSCSSSSSCSSCSSSSSDFLTSFSSSRMEKSTLATPHDVRRQHQAFLWEPLRNNHRDTFRHCLSEMAHYFHRKSLQAIEGDSDDDSATSSERTRNLFLLDWDDTMFPTSFIFYKPNSRNSTNSTNSRHNKTNTTYYSTQPRPDIHDYRAHIQELEYLLLNLLRKFTRMGRVIIVTNSSEGWVESSSKMFFPLIYKEFFCNQSIKIVPAKHIYLNNFPDLPVQWKIEAFREEVQAYKEFYPDLQVWSFGDSFADQLASQLLIQQEHRDTQLRFFKFFETPTLDMLSRQWQRFSSTFESMVTKSESMAIQLMALSS